jgi:hypothetical protein
MAKATEATHMMNLFVSRTICKGSQLVTMHEQLEAEETVLLRSLLTLA